MKILIFGSNGQVGSETSRVLSFTDEVLTVKRSDVDLTDPIELKSYLRHICPDVIVNCAAYNEVDKAETDSLSAFAVNSDAVAVMGEEMKRSRGVLIHYSTDFVFDGKSNRPYNESDDTNPLSRYGASKLSGEEALRQMDAPAIVLRTAWVWSLQRKCFVTTILRLIRTNDVVSVVDDQIGNPTSASDLSLATAHIINSARRELHDFFMTSRGVYHAANEGHCSRYEFAKTIVDLDPRKSEHKVTHLNPTSSDDFPSPAARPKHAPLDCSKLRDKFGIRLPPWRTSLEHSFKNRT